jgi:hypothetical protein
MLRPARKTRHFESDTACKESTSNEREVHRAEPRKFRSKTASVNAASPVAAQVPRAIRAWCDRSDFMPGIVFVHGTGVRRNAYAESFGAIRRVLSAAKGWAVQPCLWGDEHGAQLGRGGISIPDFDATLSPEAASEAEQQVALWAALYEDPLYELRLWELRREPAGAKGFNRGHSFDAVKAQVSGLANAESLAAPLRDCEIGDVWADAVAQVTESFEFRGALVQGGALNTELREAIARALAATALQRRGRRMLFEPMSGAARDQLTALIVELLGGRDQGVVGFVAARYLTRKIQRARGQVSAEYHAVAGDILLYQARGQGIRDRIRQTIEQVEPPVVVLAHSLGGVAAVDLLIETDLSARVKQLITVGSQAPFFYEINALVSLPFGQPLKSHFPDRWLNIYDPRDFLSYLARGVFHQAGPHPQIRDVRVDNQEPFPQSHTAYWNNTQVWNVIQEELPPIES